MVHGPGCSGGGGMCSCGASQSGNRANPTTVRKVDRVIADDIEEIQWSRGGLTTTFSSKEIIALFDGNKDTCVQTPARAPPQGPFLVGDVVRVIFKEPIQVQNIQIVRKEDRTFGGATVPVATDVTGDYEIVFTDPTLPNLLVPNANIAVVVKKVSAFSFTFDEQVDDICEITVKFFQHAEVTVSVQAEVDVKGSCAGGDDSIDADMRVDCAPVGPCNPVPIAEKDILSAADILLARDGNTLLTQAEIDSLFDCNNSTGRNFGTDLQLRFKVPQYVEEFEFYEDFFIVNGGPRLTGTWQVIEEDGITFSSYGATGKLELEPKRKILGVVFRPSSLPVDINHAVIRTFGSKHVHAPESQPVAIHNINQIVREDIATITLNGVPLTEAEIQALFDKRADPTTPEGAPFVAIPANGTIVVKFKMPKQLATLEGDELTTPTIAHRFNWVLTTAEGVSLSSTAATRLFVANAKISQVQLQEADAVAFSLSELLFKTFDESQQVLPPESLPIPIAEKDVVSAQDIFSIKDGLNLLTSDQIRTLFDRNITTSYNILTNLAFLFRTPEYIEEAEITGVSGTDIIGTWSIAYTDGTTVNVAATGRLKIKDIKKEKVFLLTFTPTAVPVPATQVVIRTYGSKHVHAPENQPVAIHNINQIVREDIASITLNGVPLTEAQIQALFDKVADTATPGGAPSVPIPFAGTLLVNFKMPKQLATLEGDEATSPSVAHAFIWVLTTAEGSTLTSFGAAVKLFTAGAKISQVQMSEGFVGAFNLSELLFKTFDESQSVTAPGSLPVPISEKDVASAADVLSILDGATPLTSQQIAALFDCNPNTTYTVVTGPLKVRFRCPQYVEEIEAITAGTSPPTAALANYTFTDANGVVVTQNGTRRAEIKRKIIEFTVGGLVAPFNQLQDLIVRTFGSKHVHAPVEQPVNVNIRDEVVLEDIASITLNGAPLTEGQIQALFDKDQTTAGVLLAIGDDLHVTFRKLLQIESVEALDTTGSDRRFDWDFVYPDGGDSVVDKKFVVVKHRTEEIILTALEAVNIGELVFKKYIDVEVHGNDKIDPQEDFVVTQDPPGFQTARTFNTRKFKSKTFFFENTDVANSLDIRMFKSLDGVNFDVPFVLIDETGATVVTLGPGESLEKCVCCQVETGFQLQTRRTVAAAGATLRSKAYMLGV